MYKKSKSDEIEYNNLMNEMKKENNNYKKIIYSKQYKIGKNIVELINNVKSVKKLVASIDYKIRWKFLCKKYPMIEMDNLKNREISNYFSDEKFVVYTCIFGKYDILQEPVCKPNNCDFYLLTDQKFPETFGWNVIDVSNKIPNYEKLSNVEKNRFCKMLPFEIFKNYNKSIYIDGNIKPITDLTEFINCDMKHGMVFFNHKSRKCVYDEIEACKILKKAKNKPLKKYKTLIWKEGFPKNYGMVECNFIVRNHKNNEMKKIMYEWWRMFLENDVKRDQIYLPYILWKHKINIDEINTLGNNIQWNNSIRSTLHVS